MKLLACQNVCLLVYTPNILEAKTTRPFIHHSALKLILINFQIPSTKPKQVQQVCFKDSKNILHDSKISNLPLPTYIKI